MAIEIKNKEDAEKAIIAIAQELIIRSKDICNDLLRVQSIDIHAVLNPVEIVSFDITKTYIADFQDVTLDENAGSVLIHKVENTEIRDYMKGG